MNTRSLGDGFEMDQSDTSHTCESQEKIRSSERSTSTDRYDEQINGRNLVSGPRNFDIVNAVQYLSIAKLKSNLPMTPTLTISFVGMFSTFMESEDDRRALKDRLLTEKASALDTRASKRNETFIIVVVTAMRKPLTRFLEPKCCCRCCRKTIIRSSLRCLEEQLSSMAHVKPNNDKRKSTERKASSST